MIRGKLKFLFTVFILFFTVGMSGQSSAKVTIGDKKVFHSKILNEDRTVYIYVPDSYKQSTFSYPTLYLLDAEYDFVSTVGAVEFMSSVGKIPEMIVVGIVNTNRSRDLTPEAPKDKESKAFWGEIGGADNFRGVIKNELIPFIEQGYRTNGFKILRGQSFGGLFGLFDYLKRLPLFNAYIISSPTVRWNENMLFNELSHFSFNILEKRKLYIGEAEFDSGTDTGIRDFSQLLQSIIIDSNYFGYHFFKGESHYSLAFDTTQKGLEYLYRNWQLDRGLLAAGDYNLLVAHYKKVSDEFGFPMKVPMSQMIDFENIQLRKSHYEKAIEIAEKNVQLYPEQPETYWHLGDAYSFSKDYKKALEYFEKALKKARENGLKNLDDYMDSVENTKSKIE